MSYCKTEQDLCREELQRLVWYPLPWRAVYSPGQFPEVRDADDALVMAVQPNPHYENMPAPLLEIMVRQANRLWEGGEPSAYPLVRELGLLDCWRDAGK